MKLHSVWAEVARPNVLDEIALPVRLKNTFRTFIETKDMPNILMLSYSGGTGKTTIAQMLAKEMQTSILYLNGSLEKGIDVLRGEVETFLKSPCLAGIFDDREPAPFKIVYIDEADGLTKDFQKGLKGIINDYSHDARFILTVNNEELLDDKILSRFIKLKFEYTIAELEVMVDHFYKRVISILDENKIEYDTAVVEEIILSKAPDFRDCWQELQEAYLENGKIASQNINSQKEIEELISAICSNKRTEVIKCVCESQTIQLNSIWTALFKNIKLFKPTFRINDVTMLLGDYSYKSKFATDKLLNFMAWYSDLWMRHE